MATTTIPWGDGSGDNIYLTYPSASGNQTVEVTSDANTGYVNRTKDITFTTTAGDATVTKVLSVNQASGISPVYEISSPVTTQEFDTGVKLFDTPKSFTILCEAKFRNSGWGSGWTQGVFGILDGKKNYTFKVGSVNNGYCIVSDEYSATANRYTALLMNPVSTDKHNVSLAAYSTSSLTRRLAVRYDASTRIARGWGTANAVTTYFTVQGDVSSDNTLKLLIGGATGTISIFRVYLAALPDAAIQAFYDE